MSSWRKRLQMESEPAGAETPRTVFMTGCMRSGTSFLVGKLSQHPQILHVGSELNKVWTDIGGAPCTEECAYRDESDFNVLSAQNMAIYFADYARQSRTLRRMAMRWRHKQRTGSGRVNYDWENILCLNKSTHLTNKVRYVKSLFPDSKWIVLIRSVLGSSASTKVFFQGLNSQGYDFTMPEAADACWTMRRDVQSAATTDFESIVAMWLRLNNRLLQDLSHLPQEDVLLVPYERLVEQQAREVKRIFGHLGLNAEHEAEAQRIAGYAMPAINTSTKGNPLTKWRKHLAENEKDILLSVLREREQDFVRINERVHEITQAQGDPFRYPDPVRVVEEGAL